MYAMYIAPERLNSYIKSPQQLSDENMSISEMEGYFKNP